MNYLDPCSPLNSFANQIAEHILYFINSKCTIYIYFFFYFSVIHEYTVSKKGGTLKIIKRPLTKSSLTKHFLRSEPEYMMKCKLIHDAETNWNRFGQSYKINVSISWQLLQLLGFMLSVNKLHWLQLHLLSFIKWKYLLGFWLCKHT